jgi:hypothetical protein
MIVRLLIAFVIAILAITLWKRLRSGSKPQLDRTESELFNETVTCKTCGLRLPKAEAIRQGDAYYCCREHIGE